MRRWRRVWLPALALATLLAGGCRDATDDVEVKAFTIQGVHAFPVSQLKSVLATRATPWPPWAAKSHFDRKAFEADLKRIVDYYADRGYPNARVASFDVKFSDDKESVRLTVTIDEGQPIIVDQIILTGFDPLPASDITHFRSQMSLQPGKPRDREQLAATRDAARHLLRESGYAYAVVDTKEGPTAKPDHVVIELAAVPGPKTYFGPIDVTGLTSVKGIVVHRSMRFAQGDSYRESLVIASQRRLASLQVFDFVLVKTEPPPGQQVTELPTLVTVTEASKRRVEFGVGYGTEDHFRASINWRNFNLGGGAQQFSAQAKWSSTLSGAAVDYSIPYPFRRVTSGEIGGYAWLTSAPAYNSQTYGGTVRAVYSFNTTAGAHRREDRDVILSIVYRNEYEKYQLTESAGQDLTFSEKIALGFDPATGQGSSRLASLGATIDHNAVDRPRDPQRGYGGTLNLRHAAPWLGGSVRFDEVRFEARGYYPVGRTVAAARVQFGTILAASDENLPVTTRYYLGGTTTMRGWGRFELSPLAESGEPIGGKSLFSITTEARFPIRGNFGGVLFFEGGNVWANSGEFHLGDLRYDVGPGVRWASPIGIFRGDFGWQLTPIPGLQVDNELLTRRWRIQISFGQAF